MVSQLFKYFFCFFCFFQAGQPYPTIVDCERRLSALDDLAAKSKKKVIKVPALAKKGQLAFLILYYKDSIPVKLEYPTFEVSGSFVGYDYIYFDERGKMFAEMMGAGDHQKIVDVFLVDHGVMGYSRSPDGGLRKSEMDKKLQKYREQDYVYLVDFYMQFFPEFKYSRATPATDCPPVLRTQKNNVILLDAPGGKPILKLKEGEYLNYLDRSLTQMPCGGQKWTFLKVATGGKKIGWVCGSPDLVSDDGGEE